MYRFRVMIMNIEHCHNKHSMCVCVPVQYINVHINTPYHSQNRLRFERVFAQLMQRLPNSRRIFALVVVVVVERTNTPVETAIRLRKPPVARTQRVRDASCFFRAVFWKLRQTPISRPSGRSKVFHISSSISRLTSYYEIPAAIPRYVARIKDKMRSAMCVCACAWWQLM